MAQGQLRKQLITSTDCPQAGVNHDERSHTKRIKSSLPAVASMSDGVASEANEKRGREGGRDRETEKEGGLN